MFGEWSYRTLDLVLAGFIVTMTVSVSCICAALLEVPPMCFAVVLTPASTVAFPGCVGAACGLMCYLTSPRVPVHSGGRLSST